MRPQPGAATAALALALLPVMASGARAAGCPRADLSLAGHYDLHGVMEVGCELLLKPDGRFEYMLAYGALDELASGCWARRGGMVTLYASKFEANTEVQESSIALILQSIPEASSSVASTASTKAPTPAGDAIARRRWGRLGAESEKHDSVSENGNLWYLLIQSPDRLAPLGAARRDRRFGASGPLRLGDPRGEKIFLFESAVTH